MIENMYTSLPWGQTSVEGLFAFAIGSFFALQGVTWYMHVVEYELQVSRIQLQWCNGPLPCNHL